MRLFNTLIIAGNVGSMWLFVSISFSFTKRLLLQKTGSPINSAKIEIYKSIYLQQLREPLKMITLVIKLFFNSNINSETCVNNTRKMYVLGAFL